MIISINCLYIILRRFLELCIYHQAYPNILLFLKYFQKEELILGVGFDSLHSQCIFYWHTTRLCIYIV